MYGIFSEENILKIIIDIFCEEIIFQLDEILKLNITEKAHFLFVSDQIFPHKKI